MKTLMVDNVEVLLDDYDWLRFCKMKWHIRPPKDGENKYIRTTKIIGKGYHRKQYTIYMHRAVVDPPYGLSLPKDIEVHHINNNVWDNRAANLQKLKRDDHGRLTRQNACNDSGECDCDECNDSNEVPF